MRSLTTAALFVALASAFFLYTVSYDARRLERQVAAKERKLEMLRSDIAVLKAERAHLARPERIEPVARAMGLRAVQGHQMLPLSSGRANFLPTDEAH
jgi:cell division protein FtsL